MIFIRIIKSPSRKVDAICTSTCNIYSLLKKKEKEKENPAMNKLTDGDLIQFAFNPPHPQDRACLTMEAGGRGPPVESSSPTLPLFFMGARWGFLF